MVTTDIATERPPAVRRVSWGAIIVGAVVAMALMVFFATLGIAIGGAVVDPLQEARPLAGVGIGSGIYTVVTQIISLAVGGFAAARLAGVPRTIGSVLHGAAVWAATTLFLAWAALLGGSAVFGTAATTVSNMVRGATDAVQTVMPDNLSFPDVSELAGQISLNDLPPQIAQTLRENGVTPAQLQSDAAAAFRNVISAQEQQRAVDILQTALTDAVRSPGDTQSDINDAFDSLVGGPDAVFSQEDRQEVLTTLERRLGITPQEAEQIAQSIETRIEEAIDEARQMWNAAQQQALEAAQTATSMVASTATMLTIASILGLLAAAGGAMAGRPEGFLGERASAHRY
ncbi:MAG: hypothetical protein ACU0GG_05075 [Paracoccaceae bacterium]